MGRIGCVGFVGCILLGCVNPDTGGSTLCPTLDDTLTAEAIVTGYFARGWYARQFSHCHEPHPDHPDVDVVCLDPPPMILDFRVESVVAGELPKRKVRLFTTSHWGLQSIDFGARHMFLVCVVTDGTSHVMPRYRMRWLATNTSDELALETSVAGEISDWLPSGMVIEPKPMRFRDAKSELDGFTPEELAALGETVEVDGEWIRPLRGVELDEIEAAWTASESSVHCSN